MKSIRECATGALVGVMMVVSLWLAYPAKADVYTDYTEAICSTLDEYPSPEGIIGIGSYLVNKRDLEPAIAADLVVQAIEIDCPRYIPILIKFATRYGGFPSRTTA